MWEGVIWRKNWLHEREEPDRYFGGGALLATNYATRCVGENWKALKLIKKLGNSKSFQVRENATITFDWTPGHVRIAHLKWRNWTIYNWAKITFFWLLSSKLRIGWEIEEEHVQEFWRTKSERVKSWGPEVLTAALISWRVFLSSVLTEGIQRMAPSHPPIACSIAHRPCWMLTRQNRSILYLLSPSCEIL